MNLPSKKKALVMGLADQIEVGLQRKMTKALIRKPSSRLIQLAKDFSLEKISHLYNVRQR